MGSSSASTDAYFNADHTSDHSSSDSPGTKVFRAGFPTRTRNPRIPVESNTENLENLESRTGQNNDETVESGSNNADHNSDHSGSDSPGTDIFCRGFYGDRRNPRMVVESSTESSENLETPMVQNIEETVESGSTDHNLENVQRRMGFDDRHATLEALVRHYYEKHPGFVNEKRSLHVERDELLADNPPSHAGASGSQTGTLTFETLKADLNLEEDDAIKLLVRYYYKNPPAEEKKK